MRDQRSNRFALMLTDMEVAEIEDFRFAVRVGSRAGAVRRLIQSGLAAEKKKGPAAAQTAPGSDHQQPLETTSEHVQQ